MASVNYEVDNGIAVITFTNPPKGFFTTAMVEEATKALAEAENDDTVKVVIFTGGLHDVFIRHFSDEEIILMTEAVRDHRR